MKTIAKSIFFLAVFCIASASKPVKSEVCADEFIDCSEYTYERGFNHAKNVRMDCSLSPSILQNTYDLNMSNPCFMYRVGFQEGWFAYQGHCSLGGGNGGGSGGGGGGGEDDNPSDPGGPIQ